MVVEGPPGTGKNALLTQYQEEMRNLPLAEGHGRRWLPVVMNGSRAESPAAIQQSVDAAIAKRLAKDAHEGGGGAGNTSATKRLRDLIGSDELRKAGMSVREAAKQELDRDFGVMGFRIGAAPRDAVEDIEAVVERRAPHWCDWRIVLLIDEAQGISNRRADAVPGTLASIHRGEAPPLTLCALGLSGTADALAKVRVNYRR